MSNSNDEEVLSEAGSMEVIPNNDSDSSEDEDDEEKERELELQADELEKRLVENYYDYAAYENLVKIRRQLTDIEGLRKTFEKFSTVYPLTGELWLLWIRSEMAIANSEIEIQKVTELFEKAVQDYLSVNVWLEYVQFGLKNPDINNIRKLFERAISAAGLHVPQGSLLWDAYREFELAHLSLITDSASEEWLTQAQRVASIFKRQLSIPLSDMEITYVELQNWRKELPRKDEVIVNIDYEYIFDKSQRDLKKISPYEEDVMNAKNDIEKLEYFEKYIDYERSYPNRVNILYERAVNEVPLNAEFWLKYCKHTVNLGTESLALNICKRSVRNCSWNSSLWVYFLQSMEFFEKDHDTITKEFELGLVACSHDARSQLLLWLCYLEHCKRAVSTHLTENVENSDGNAMETDNKKVDLNIDYLRNVFSKANTHLYETWGQEGDPNCLVLQFWARIEGSLCKDMEAARKIWTDISRIGPKDTADLWLECLNLEIRFGDAKHVRRAHLRALNATKDWPNRIVDSWVNYERECGTIQSIMECNSKCFEIIEKWKKIQLEKQTYENTKSYEKQKYTKNSQNYETKHERNDNRKRKSEYKLSESEGRETKKTKSYESELTAISNLNMGEKNIGEKQKETNDNKQLPPSQPPVEMDAETESRTVFISNLDYSVDENRLSEFFGTVKSLRLVKDYKGRSKGFGYVELNSIKEVEEILKRDRERLDDRPVFISRCKTAKEKREQAFKYSTTREQHKLFVKGLPLKITQEEVEKIFAAHGKLKDIRMVCYRNGHFKGLAYIEFEKAADAARALVKTDNTEIDGHVISVAISAPPQRNLRDAGDSGYKEPATRKNRLQIPLVPTILQKKVVQSTSTDSEQKPKSNDDFRKMLLK